MISDEEILNLWKDKTFSGSFRGIKTFQACLKTDKNIDISEHRLYSILKQEPLFLTHQRSKKNLKDDITISIFTGN